MEFVIEAAGTHSKRCVLRNLKRHCLCYLWRNTSAQRLNSRENLCFVQNIIC